MDTNTTWDRVDDLLVASLSWTLDEVRRFLVYLDMRSELIQLIEHIESGCV